MLFEDSRKLKRGLKDLSPLFNDLVKREQEPLAQKIATLIPPQPQTATLMPSSLQCLSVYHADYPDSFDIGAYFTGQMQAEGQSSSLISIHDGIPRKLRFSAPQLRLSLEDLDTLSKAHFPAEQRMPVKPHHFFLDFSSQNPSVFEKLIPFLDKWILVMKPVLENMTETYRMLKEASVLNPSLEYFLVFDMPADHVKSSLFFERFSEIVSRRLGITVQWIGYLQTKEGMPLFQEMAWQVLCAEPFENTRMIEKKRLMNFCLSENKIGKIA